MLYIRAMIRLFAALAALSCLVPAGYGETLPGPIPADVLRVVDGDTIRVRAHIWLDQSVEIMVRIDGIDAPEIHRPDCSVESRLADQAKAEVEAFLDKKVFLHNIHLGKYAGRVVANVRIQDGTNLADHLLSKGLAHPDEERLSWCQKALPTTPSARP